MPCKDWNCAGECWKHPIVIIRDENELFFFLVGQRDCTWLCARQMSCSLQAGFHPDLFTSLSSFEEGEHPELAVFFARSWINPAENHHFLSFFFYYYYFFPHVSCLGTWVMSLDIRKMNFVFSTGSAWASEKMQFWILKSSVVFLIYLATLRLHFRLPGFRQSLSHLDQNPVCWWLSL